MKTKNEPTGGRHMSRKTVGENESAAVKKNGKRNQSSSKTTGSAGIEEQHEKLGLTLWMRPRPEAKTERKEKNWETGHGLERHGPAWTEDGGSKTGEMKNSVAEKAPSTGRMKTKNKQQRQCSKKTPRSGDVHKSAKRTAHKRCEN
jgi:hypothetical protein